MYCGFGAGVSREGLRSMPGIDRRKEGRIADRARVTGFEGPGVGVEGGSEG